MTASAVVTSAAAVRFQQQLTAASGAAALNSVSLVLWLCVLLLHLTQPGGGQAIFDWVEAGLQQVSGVFAWVTSLILGGVLIKHSR